MSRTAQLSRLCATALVISSGSRWHQHVSHPSIARQCRSWLKTGVVADHQLQATDKGTPYGGVIAPLLANIVLHS